MDIQILTPNTLDTEIKSWDELSSSLTGFARIFQYNEKEAIYFKEGFFLNTLNIVGFGRYYKFYSKTCILGYWDTAHGQMFLNGKGIIFEDGQTE